MNPAIPIDDEYLFSRYPFARLLRPGYGILSAVTRLTGEHTAPDLEIAHSGLDNLTKVFPHVISPDGRDAAEEPLGGAGADIGPEKAWIRAVVEGAERYASMAYETGDFVLASGNELGSAAMDLDAVPRCSAAEYADPQCPFEPPDKSRPIRWVKGYSLMDRCERYVPAVMTHLYMQPLQGERFWQVISTGIAAHTALETAINSAICEVIERDAISISWLARLPLPRITLTEPVPAELASHHRALDKSLVKHNLFDATTDVGVPTVYCVQTLEGRKGESVLSQYVNCATGFDAAACCAKTIREAAPSRAVFQFEHDLPGEVRDFRSLYDGATYLGRPDKRSEFDFLLNTPNQRALEDMDAGFPADDKGRMRELLSRLARMDTDVIIVDLTTDELREVGLWVVRAVIPGLMPMSPTYRGRFLGHPRLYDYPERCGHGRLTEADINPAPQPFA